MKNAKILNILAVAFLSFGGACFLNASSEVPPSSIAGNYLEVRSCDVYTGPCFANAEMGLDGKEAIMVWSVEEGYWGGADLSGLSVIAVVRTDDTLGDLDAEPRRGKAVLIVDEKAGARQKKALRQFAKSMAGDLIDEVVGLHSSAISASYSTCEKKGCSAVEVPGLVSISTRCIGGKDHLCGNEYNYYPPLTKIEDPLPAYTSLFSYQGDELDLTWESTDLRSAFIGKFTH